MKSFIETLLHNVLVRFVVVGGSVAVIQLAMLYGLHTKLHLPSLTASIIAFIISVFINFGLQKFWSFKDPSKNTIATQFGYFALNALGNLVINIACMYIGVSLLHINTYIMQPLTLALIALCNFFIYKIIFRYKERQEKIHDVSLRQVGFSFVRAGRQWANTFTGRAIIAIILISIVTQVSAAFGLYTLEQRYPDFDHNLLAIPVIGQDSPDFFHLAHHMRTEHIFSVDGIKPETFRTPGYPLFLALTGNGWVSVFFSMLITAATAMLVFSMAHRMLPSSQQRWAIAAGVLYALAPSVIFHGVVFLSDGLFTALVVLVTYMLFFTEWSHTKVVAGISGLLLGYAALVRPIGMFLPIVVGVLLVVGQRHSRKQALINALLVCIGFGMVILPWMYRNHRLTGEWAISSITNYNMAFYNVQDFLRGEEKVAYHQTLVDLEKKYDMRALEHTTMLRTLVAHTLQGRLVSYGIFHLMSIPKFLLASSIRYISINTGNVFNGFLHIDASAGGIKESLKHAFEQPLLTLDRLYQLGVTVLALGSAIVAWRQKKLFPWVVLATLIVYFAVLTGPVAIPRYRLPIDGFVLILAAVSAAALHHKIRRNS